MEEEIQENTVSPDHARPTCRNKNIVQTHLFRGNPLVLGKTLVEDGLLHGGPDSESTIVLLSLGQTGDGLPRKRMTIDRDSEVLVDIQGGKIDLTM